jgi:hypothetical protein
MAKRAASRGLLARPSSAPRRAADEAAAGRSFVAVQMTPKALTPLKNHVLRLCCLTFELSRATGLGALPARPMMNQGGCAGKATSLGASALERGVRPHRADLELSEAQPCNRARRALEVAHELAVNTEAELPVESARPEVARGYVQGHRALSGCEQLTQECACNADPTEVWMDKEPRDQAAFVACETYRSVLDFGEPDLRIAE